SGSRRTMRSWNSSKSASTTGRSPLPKARNATSDTLEGTVESCSAPNDHTSLTLRVDGMPYHLVVETTADHAIGTALTVAVRPEAIRLRAAPGCDRANQWHVTVRSWSWVTTTSAKP